MHAENEAALKAHVARQQHKPKKHGAGMALFSNDFNREDDPDLGPGAGGGGFDQGPRFIC
jgi:hypothetical protein